MAQYWIHLQITNPVESIFATARLTTRVIKGPGRRAAGLAMTVKLIEAAQHRWRCVTPAPGRPRSSRSDLQQGDNSSNDSTAMINVEVASEQLEAHRCTGVDIPPRRSSPRTSSGGRVTHARRDYSMKIDHRVANTFSSGS